MLQHVVELQLQPSLPGPVQSCQLCDLLFVAAFTNGLFLFQTMITQLESDRDKIGELAEYVINSERVWYAFTSFSNRFAQNPTGNSPTLFT
jgi:hypothetical protein